MNDLDWRWLKSFAAVAEEGGMQAAANATGISQPTLSRHIRQLEELLGVVLFERHGRGLTLSPQGAGLFERALVVRDSIHAFERQAVGLSEEESGTVRVTMTRVFSFYFAPQWLVALRRAHPHISIDLVMEDAEVNLLMREAEIAIRMFRPRQLDLVARHCGQTSMGFFASPGYVEAYGQPADLEALKRFDLIGFDRQMDWIETARHMGFNYEREDFVFRTDALDLHLRVAEVGLGIAVLPLWLGACAGLVRLLGEVTIPGLPIYLTAHPELKRNPRVYKVWRHLDRKSVV